MYNSLLNIAGTAEKPAINSFLLDGLTRHLRYYFAPNTVIMGESEPYTPSPLTGEGWDGGEIPTTSTVTPNTYPSRLLTGEEPVPAKAGIRACPELAEGMEPKVPSPLTGEGRDGGEIPTTSAVTPNTYPSQLLTGDGGETCIKSYFGTVINIHLAIPLTHSVEPPPRLV